MKNTQQKESDNKSVQIENLIEVQQPIAILIKAIEEGARFRLFYNPIVAHGNCCTFGFSFFRLKPLLKFLKRECAISVFIG